MGSEHVRFMNRSGDELAGILDTPDDGPVRATALFAHCFTCNKNLRPVRRISRALNEAGFAVLRFDFTGLGDSEGEFADTNFSSNVDDLVAAADYLAGTGTPVTLGIGHSLGGTAMLMAVERMTSLAAVVTIGSPARADHVRHLFAGGEEALATDGVAQVDIGGRPFTIRRQLLDDLAAQSVPQRVAKLRMPLLIFHSPVDDIVGIDNAAEIFSQALHPKSFITLDKADHLLTNETDAAYVGSMTAAWASRYLETAGDVVESAVTLDEAGVDDAAADVVVATTGAEGFLTKIRAHGHPLVADEPAGVGGTDAGPSPYGLLAGALAGCTSMTLQMYARHKGLALESVSVTVRHAKVHAQDCEHCETQTGKIDRFDRAVAMTGNLSAEERSRLLEIADRCPVHRTLTGEIEIRTIEQN